MPEATLEGCRKAVLNNPPTKSSNLLLHQLFTRNESDSIALSYTARIDLNPEEFTYAQLHKISDAVAQDLSLAGIHGQIIPVVLPQSPDLYISILAILKSGNAYCPILPSAPAERVNFICQDIRAPAIFTSSKSQLDLPQNVRRFSCTGRMQDTRQMDYEPPSINPSDLAYVMYTSGSTGQPKGVMISHSAASTSILAHDDIFCDLTSGDSFLQFANSTFDISIFEIFSAWARGMALVSAERSILTTMLPELISKRQIKYMELTPSMAGLLPDSKHPSMASVKALITIGEMLTRKVIQNWAGKLFNAYGPTEATLHATFTPVSRPDQDPALIGAPLTSCALAILEPETVSVLADSDLGELCIAGPQVALGYLNREDLTNAAFIEHADFEGSLYRTGDLARIVDGRVHFAGRKQGDTQVKINGQRLELGELEHAISQYSFVQDCAVISLGQSLYAFIVPDSLGSNDTAEDLFDSIHDLPLDARPIYIRLESIPSSSSSKRDNKKLKSLAEEFADQQNQSPQHIDETRLSPSEIRLLAIVRSQLGASFKAGSRFSAFGLDSLGAIKIVMLLREENLETSVYDVLESNSIKILDQRCRKGNTSAGESDTSGIQLSIEEKQELKGLYGRACKFAHTSALQASMVSATISDPARRNYLNHVLLQHEGNVSNEDFVRAWQSLVAKNEILRTGFHIQTNANKSEFIQIIHPADDEKILSERQFSEGDDVQAFANEHKHAISLNSANLQSPAIDTRFLRLDTRSVFISIVIHHALYDAWSLQLMVNDLSRLLQGKQPEQRAQFSDTLATLQHNPSNQALSTEYWSKYLQAWESVPFPILAKVADQAPQKRRLSKTCSVSLEALDRACLHLETNPQAIGQLTWALFLSWTTSQQAPGMALTTSGRTFPVAQLDNTLGPFITTFPFYLNCGNERAIEDALHEIKQYNLQLTTHNLAYRDILNAAHIQTAPDTLFIYQKTGADLDSDRSLEIVAEEDRLEFPIMLTIDRTPSALLLHLDARTDVISEGAGNTVLEQVNYILENIVCDQPQTLGDLKIMPEELLSSSESQSDYIAAYERIDDLFSALKFTTTNLPAVEFYDTFQNSTSLTYAELNRHADVLASSFREVETSPDEIIAICLDKCIALYASMLAIWKLGCAYVAIDPVLPEERLEATQQITKFRHVFTDKRHSARFKSVNKILVDDEDAIASDDRPFAARPTDGLAYILMTSGSTGVPKACAVTHANVLANNDVLSEIYPHSPHDRMLQFCSYTFDVSVFEIVFAWRNRMCLVSCPKDLMLSDLTNVMDRFSITHTSMTTTAASLLRAQSLPKLKCIISAGEPASRGMIQEWGGTGRYFNAYGPTELTNVCTVQPVTSVEMYPAVIGPMLSNSSGYVLDNDLNILPKFALGELYVGGSQVIRGYLGDEDKTRKAFVDHPQLGRLYRTGDLVRLLEDGTVSIQGRADSQVKVRGHRVELDEINHVLRGESTVNEAVTILHDASLVSFVLKEGNVDSNEKSEDTLIDELFEVLRRKVPEYMVPAFIIPRSEPFPVTVSHKLDATALLQDLEQFQKRNSNDISDSARRETEWTDSSKQVAQIISDIAGISLSNIRPDTSIFKLGLDSISAIRISTAVRNAGLGELSVSSIMQTGTPAAMAANLEQSQGTGKTDLQKPNRYNNALEKSLRIIDTLKKDVLEDLECHDSDVLELMPCTSLQTGILLESLRRQDVDYINHSIIRLRGKIDSLRLKAACQRLIDDNKCFRTCFAFTSHNQFPCIQAVMKDSKLSWHSKTTHDFSSSLEEWKVSISERTRPQRPSIEFLDLVCEETHCLIISMHHSLFDGWSLNLLRQDLDCLYREAAYTARPEPRPAIIAAFEASLDVDQQMPFWNDLLSEYRPFTLPLLTTTSQRTRLICSNKLQSPLSRLNGIAATGSTSLLTILQTSWALLLSQIVGSNDVCFGSAISGRTIVVDNVDMMTTPLFNVLPMRINFDNDSSVMDVLRNVHAVNLQHLKNPHFPLRSALKAAQLSEGEELFDSILILQQAAPDLSNTIIEDVTDDGDNNYALMIEFIPETKLDAISLRFTASNDRISERTIKHLADQLNSLLCLLVDQTSSIQSIIKKHAQSFPALTEAVETTVETDLLHSGFLRNVQNKPDSPAIQYLNETTISTISYASLSERVDAAVAGIQALQFKHSTPIVVMMSRVPDLFITFLAVLKSGMIYTPLAADTPEDRLRFILEDLRPGLIIVDEDKVKADLVDKIRSQQVMNLTSLCEKENTTSVVHRTPDYRPSDPAYIIYTSGSTGGPKAVQVSHSAAVSAVKSSAAILDLQADSKWLQFASLTFDMSVYDMSIAFTYGTCLCGAPKSQLLSDLPSVINFLSVTHLDLTPSVAKMLRKTALPSVKLLFCIGERLASSIMSEWGSTCINVYGPTEAAMACTSHRVTPHSISQNIGFPFESAQIGIFSPHGTEPLALLSIGELCIAGPQLCDGYLHAEEKNKSAFFDHLGERFYRTGDLCRLLSDGSLAYIGRKDFQAKLRGQRIELEEISSELVRRGSHISAASTLIETYPGQDLEQLVSFVSITQQYEDDDVECKIVQVTDDEIDAVTSALKKVLPIYMIPSHYIRLNYLPLNKAQKVNRGTLIRLWEAYAQQQNKSGSMQDTEELTKTEGLVQRVIADISGLEPSSIHRKTSIYHVGLDSISAIQIVASLRKENVGLSVVDVLQNTTTEKLAKFIDLLQDQDEAQATTYEIDTSRFEQLSRTISKDRSMDGILYPCTPVQENMVAQFLNTNGNAYYNHIVFRLEAPVDIDKLAKAWIRVIETSEILRAGFVSIDRKGCQYALNVHEDRIAKALVKIEVVTDLSKAIGTTLQSNTNKVFNKVSYPSLDIHLFKDAQEAKCLLFSAHHAIYDGQSLQTIFSRVAEAYKDDSTLSDMTLGSSLGTLWSLYHDEARTSAAETFWNKVLAESVHVPFPNLNKSIDKSRMSSNETLTLQHSLCELEAKCKDSGASLANLSMAIWSKVLSAYTGEAGVTFGNVLSGRAGTGLEDAMLPCIATVPMALILRGTVKSFVQAVGDFSAQALQHQHISLSKLHRDDGAALFDTLFVYQIKSQDSLNNDLWQIEEDRASVEVPLSIEVLSDRVKDQIELSLTYQPATLPRSHAVVLLRQFEAVLLAMLDNPEVDVLDIEEYLPPDLLSILPPTTPIFDVPVKLVHEHVAYFAQKTPEAVALEFTEELEGESRCWTYQQLEAQSNQLARHLVSNYGLKGVEPIAVCFDKSPEAFISILAILKTGSPFCCLDSTAPIERRKFIIENSDSSAVLCSEHYRDDFKAHVSAKVIVVANLDQLTTSTEPLSIELQDSALCYILYTSGSTGTPKGCCLSHRSVLQALASFQVEFKGQFDSDSRFLAFASLHFDVSVLEQYFSWSIGARVCAAPRDALLSDISGAIKRFGITHLDLTPQLAMTLLREDAESLRVFITGGEMLRAETVEHWGDSDVLFNFYGPTEVTIGCTALKQVKKGARPSNIGQQWSNCGTMVTSQLGRAKAALKGGLGDLLVSGEQVAEGYMKLPEATSKRFVYNDQLKAKTYDTGDLVRLLEVDHSFDFAGRADSQIKLRGQRIETGEIDSVLANAATNVRDAVTVVLKHKTQQKDQLISFIVYKDDYTATNEAKILYEERDKIVLFSACKESLSTYMIPSYIIPITRIELTATNKVDSKRLRSLFDTINGSDLPQFGHTKSDRVTESANPEILKIIKTSLSEMTDVAEIDDHTSAFELGLDSVSVIGLVRKLRSAGLQTCSVAAVMASPDVLSLGSLLSKDTAQSTAVDKTSQMMTSFKRKHMANVVEQLDISETEVEDILPCTPLVEGLMTESIQGGNGLHMNSFSIAGNALDEQRLRNAFAKLVARTPVLRSRFVLLSEGLAQVFLTASCSPPDRSAEFPLKSKLLSLKETHRDGRSHFVLELHHAIYDGQSLHLLLDDFKRLHADCEDKIPPNPDFRPAIAEILSLPIAEAKQFWATQLQGYQSLSVVREPSIRSSGRRALQIGSHGLEAAAKRYKCAPNVILQSAWAILLAQLLKVDSCFGMIISGRDLAHENIDKMVYPLFNTVPVWCKTSNHNDLGTLIQEMQKTYGRMLRYQHTPLREIRKQLKLRTEDSFLDTLLVYQKEFLTDSASSNDFYIEDDTNDAAGYAVALDITASANGTLELMLNVEGLSTNAESLCDHFDLILSAMSSDEQTLGDIRRQITTVKSIDVVMRQDDTPAVRHEDSEQIRSSPEGRDVLDAVQSLLDSPSREISLSDSFSMMGLDSIDAIKLSGRLNKDGKYSISVSEIIKHDSIAQLSVYLKDRANSTSQSNDQTAIPANFTETARECLDFDKEINIEKILPASPMQSGLLTSSQINGGGLYLNHTLLKFRSQIEPSVVQDAWDKIVASNTILRTSLAAVHSKAISDQFDYVQVVHRMQSSSFTFVSCCEAELMPHYQSFKTANSKRIDDPTVVPLFLQFISTKSHSYLAISIHHALYDGTSLDMMFEELASLLQHESMDTQRPQYEVLVEHILSLSASKSDLFWSEYLKSFTPKLRPALPEAVSIKLATTSKVHLGELRELGRRLGVSLQSIIQTCCAKFFMQLSGRSDVVFGMIQGGRTFAPSADRILGPCMNTVPIRADATSNATFGALAKSLHQDNIRMVEHIHTPLRRVQKRQAKGPLFETLLVFLNSSSQDRKVIDIWDVIEEDSSVEFPLAIECNAGSETLTWTIAMHQGYLDNPDQVCHSLDEILKAMLADASDLVINPSDNIDIVSAQQQEATTSGGHQHDEKARLIMQAIAETAKVELQEIHPDLSIFSIGMDSISVISLSKHLRTKHNINISVGDILRNPTPSRLSHILSMQNDGFSKTSEDKDSIVESPADIDASSKDIDFVCSSLELNKEVLSRVLPANAAEIYFISSWKAVQGRRLMSNFAFDLDKTVDEQELNQRWLLIQQNCEILRTAFCRNEAGTRLFQCVFSEAQSKLEVFKSGVPVAEAALSEFFSSDKFFRPDLRRPPVALTLVSTTSEERVLVLSIHHALYDASSLSMIIDMLQDKCNLVMSRFDDFCQHARDKSVEGLDFWRKYLNGASRISLEHKLNMHNKDMLDHISHEAHPASVLSTRTAKFKVTSQALLLVATAQALAKFFRKQSLILGMYAAGRSLDFDQLETVIGPTLNILPIRFDSIPQTSSLELIAKTHDTLISLNGYVQQVPIDQISEVATNVTGEGGLIDVAVNILPSRSQNATTDDSTSLFREHGNLSQHLDTIRAAYAKAASAPSSVDEYQGLRTCRPCIDIEFGVVGDHIEMGVFTNGGLLSQENAETLVALIWECLSLL